MTINSIPLIGLTGFARSGKDTFFKFANLIYSNIKSFECQRFAFADELKKECDQFLLDNVGISAWTDNDLEKNVIRPFLVTYGTHVRRKLNPNCWIDKIKDDVLYWINTGNTAIITDVRYLNEVQWIKSMGGNVVNISRVGVGPANVEESEQAELMQSYIDHAIEWPTYGEKSISECAPEISKCISQLETHTELIQ